MRSSLARWLGCVVIACSAVLGSRAVTEEASRPVNPVQIEPMRWEIDVTTGVLWKVGGGATPLSYTLVPHIISFKIPPISQRPWAGGILMMRSRFSLLLEPIIH